MYSLTRQSGGRRWCRWPLILALISALGISVRAGADDVPEIPLAVKVPLFLKIMSYDRAIADAPGTVPIRVIALFGVECQGEARRESERQLSSLVAGHTLLGHRLAVEYMTWKNQSPPEVTPMTLVIAHDLAGGELAELGTWCARHPVRIFADGTEALNAPGIAVVLTLQGGSPVINVDLASARKAGADFHANFLEHCQVRR